MPAANDGLGWALTRRVCGELQSPQSLKLTFCNVNQLPPVAVEALYVKAVAAPVLATIKVWGRGSVPPNGFTKLIGLTCSITLSATKTVTGMVVAPEPPLNNNWPPKVPATNPWPGRFCLSTETFNAEGAVPGPA